MKFVGFDMSQHLGENVMAVGATLEISNISSGRALGSVTPVLGFAAGAIADRCTDRCGFHGFGGFAECGV